MLNEKIYLETVNNKILIHYNSEKQAQDGLNSTKLILPNIEYEWQDKLTAVISNKSNTGLPDIEKKLKVLPGVKFLKPVYSLVNKGLELVVTNEIAVHFKSNISQERIDSINRVYSVNIKSKSKIYILYTVPDNSDVLQVANAYQESGLVDFSHPNFIAKAQLDQALPNDTYFVNQFYLHNTGQTFNGHTGTPNADIKAPEAWSISEGCNSITVAVLDEGVTSDHIDLPNSRQIRLAGSNFADGNPNDPSPTGNSDHGNSCAGIIAATKNNNIGIAGIAPNVKIMPIRIFNSDGSGIANTTIANAITFAKNNGADVISNSWGYGSDNQNLFPLITSAIQDAVTNGRGGLGCVVVFAAGNTANHVLGNDGIVQYPANVNIAGVLTVGASDRYDLQANYSPTSSLIDVTAPSHKAYPSQIPGETFEVWSIDIPGNSGYNPWNDGTVNPPSVGEQLPNSGTNFLDFTGRFGGTSAACPQVSAVAALMLSVKPDLTQQQVFNAITGNTDKVGGYSYSNGRSNQLGFGRLNALKSLQAIVPAISGSDQLCTSNTYSIPSLPAGAAITWSANPANTVNISTSNNIATVTQNGSGTVTLIATVTNTCGTYNITKPISVGGPLDYYNVQQMDNTQQFCANSRGNWMTVEPQNISDITYFEWGYSVVNSSAPPVVVNSMGSYTQDFSFPSGGNYEIYARAGNSCGLGVTRTYNVYVSDICGGGGYGSFAAYPNPASNSMTITTSSANTSSADATTSSSTNSTSTANNTKRPFNYKIYNKTGKVLKQGSSLGEDATVDTRDLASDNYFLHVFIGKQEIQRQIIIKH